MYVLIILHIVCLYYTFQRCKARQYVIRQTRTFKVGRFWNMYENGQGKVVCFYNSW